MLQGADLEYVRIIPTFSKCRLREDKSGRFLKRKQSLIVLQNKDKDLMPWLNKDSSFSKCDLIVSLI